MCFNWLKEVICNCDECEYGENYISPPNYLEDIDWVEVDTILKAEYPNAAILLSDNSYKTTKKSEFERFIAEDITDQWQYVPEFFDCDDFSFSIMGQLSNPDWGALTFGILWTNTPNGAHAVNCFIDKDREVWILEPQNDQLYRLPGNWNPYLVIM
jgi:hypothetical protein